MSGGAKLTWKVDGWSNVLLKTGTTKVEKWSWERPIRMRANKTGGWWMAYIFAFADAGERSWGGEFGWGFRGGEDAV